MNHDGTDKPLGASLLTWVALPSLAIAYATGIWAGLWNTYGESMPSLGRIHFAILITSLPMLLPLAMNVTSILLLRNQQHRPTGKMLFVFSIVVAILIAMFIVPMGNF